MGIVESVVINKVTFRESIVTDWQRWCDYKKKQHRFTYKSEDSEQTALKKLFEYSNGNIAKAKLIIDNAIGAGWMGFNRLKGVEATRDTYKPVTVITREMDNGYSKMAAIPDKHWQAMRHDLERIGRLDRTKATDQSYYAQRKYKRFLNNEIGYSYEYICNLIYELKQYPSMKNELKYMNNVLMKSTQLKDAIYFEELTKTT